MDEDIHVLADDGTRSFFFRYLDIVEIEIEIEIFILN
jgi:hypothetical protein